MKTIIVTIFLFVFCSNSFAQIDYNKPPWETGCDSLTSQLEMNVCSYEKLKIAEGILNNYYDSLINYIEKEYQSELKLNNDTIDSIQRDYLYMLKSQQDALIKSRIDFEKFLESTTSIISYQYLNGSIRPMAENIYALDITVNQIKVLKKLMDEIMH